MKSEYDVQFVQTQPCKVCKGHNTYYQNRQCCKNCPYLREVMIQRGLIPMPIIDKPMSAPMSEVPRHGKKFALTQQQRDEIVKLDAEGSTVKQIAARFDVSAQTIRNTLERMNNIRLSKN